VHRACKGRASGEGRAEVGKRAARKSSTSAVRQGPIGNARHQSYQREEVGYTHRLAFCEQGARRPRDVQTKTTNTPDMKGTSTQACVLRAGLEPSYADRGVGRGGLVVPTGTLRTAKRATTASGREERGREEGKGCEDAAPKEDSVTEDHALFLVSMQSAQRE